MLAGLIVGLLMTALVVLRLGGLSVLTQRMAEPTPAVSEAKFWRHVNANLWKPHVLWARAIYA